MEHLIVALHSHAFLSLALLLLVLLFDLKEWLTTPDSPVAKAFSLAASALAIWVPIYLLIMQKQVYRQGWPATLAKYSVLGTFYVALVALAAAITALASMVNL